MFLPQGIPCRIAIGPNGTPVIVALDGNRVAFVALSAVQTERLAQASSKEGGK